MRLLGGTRAGEMRLTRFLRNRKVSSEAVFASAAGRTRARVRGLHVLAIQDTTSLRDDGSGASLNLHPVIAACAETGALQVTVIADREGDIFETFALRPAGVELLIRADHGRVLSNGGKLWEALGEAEETRFMLDLPAAPGRRSRPAVFALRFGNVDIRRPNSLSASLPGSVELTPDRGARDRPSGRP